MLAGKEDLKVSVRKEIKHFILMEIAGKLRGDLAPGQLPGGEKSFWG